MEKMTVTDQAPAEIEQAAIKQTILAMEQRFTRELLALTEAELVAQWHWQWSAGASRERNLYAFYCELRNLERRARQWLDHHEPGPCVVERVRDRFLMPRILEFVGALSSQALLVTRGE